MLILKSISKEYVMDEHNSVHALNDISLEFPKTGFVCILGPSGCGKTTLLNIIGGLDKYTSGDVIINGQSTKNYTNQDWDAYRNRETGIVFQSYNLIPHLTVKGNVELAMTLSGVSTKEREQRALEALDSVGLKEEVNKKPNQLSGGQMQRVALARAIVNKPNVVLADEPTGALDSVTSIQVMNILKEISKTKLVITVTHNEKLAHQYASRIITLKDGKVISDVYNNGEEEKALVNEKEQIKEVKPKTETNKPKHTSMSFWTALGISGHNLSTKKGKTVITSIAASFGIIGVGLVLALSNGFTNYVDRMEKETFSKFPISVEKYGYNYVSSSTNNLDPYSDSQVINVVEPTTSSLHINNITSDYITYLNNMNASLKKTNNSKQDYAKIRYNYSIGMHVLSKYDSNGTDVYTSINTSQESYLESLTSSVMGGSSSSAWQELPADKETILDTYDVIAGNVDDYPDEDNLQTDASGNPDQDEFGLVLVVNSRNAVTTTLMNELGMDPTVGTIDFNDILGREFKYVSNDDYYGDAISNVDKDGNLVYTPGLYFNQNKTMNDIVEFAASLSKADGSVSLDNLFDLLSIPDSATIQSAFKDANVLIKMGSLSTYIDLVKAASLISKLSSSESITLDDVKGCLKEEALNTGTDTEKTTARADFGQKLYELVIALRDSSALKPYFNKNLTYYQSPANNQDSLASLYTNSNNRTLKIKAILRPKKTTSLGLLSSGIYYPKTLTYQSFYDSQDSKIGNDYKNHILIAPSSTTNYPNTFASVIDSLYASDDTKATSINDISTKILSTFGLTTLNIVDNIKPITTNVLNTYMNVRLSLGSDIKLVYSNKTSALDPITYASFVSTITIYPTDYDSKKQVTDYLTAYNSDKDSDSQVIYTDVGQTATDIVGQIVSVISAVLIAFASISLVVSSIMIGIIIYSSVIERTKEIGILRSIGARKKDVGRLFKAEAVIIGFFSGLIGVAMTYLISIPLSLILDHQFPEVELGWIAMLNPLHALGLVALSIVLTYIASLIPARIAAKKDPVTCLRTE